MTRNDDAAAYRNHQRISLLVMFSAWRLQDLFALCVLLETEEIQTAVEVIEIIWEEEELDDRFGELHHAWDGVAFNAPKTVGEFTEQRFGVLSIPAKIDPKYASRVNHLQAAAAAAVTTSDIRSHANYYDMLADDYSQFAITGEGTTLLLIMQARATDQHITGRRKKSLS